MKRQKEEAEKYNQLQQDRKQLQRRLYLLRLYTIEREVKALQGKLDEANEEVEVAGNRYSTADEGVKAEEREKSKLGRHALPHCEAPHALMDGEISLDARAQEECGARTQACHAAASD